jgi:hypothetical protein
MAIVVLGGLVTSTRLNLLGCRCWRCASEKERFVRQQIHPFGATRTARKRCGNAHYALKVV